MNDKLLKGSINKGSIVKYNDGYVRVTAYFPKSKKVNLGGIFNGKIYHKGVPTYKVEEAYEEWYEKWSQSETYRCM